MGKKDREIEKRIKDIDTNRLVI